MTINITSGKLMKIIEFVLLVSILGLLLWSQPWNQDSSKEVRKVTVSGEATIEAAPDEYVFNPYFEAEGLEQDAVKAELTAKANDAVSKLKELGVAEEDLKLDVSSYDQWYAREDGTGVVMAYLQISVKDKDLAQKIQDYLTSSDTKVKGSLTPQATFSDEKQKELEVQATDKAIEAAKKKAEQQATLVGAKLGKVIEVQSSDVSGGLPIPYGNDALSSREVTASSSIALLPGQNEYTKTISVTYELQ
jgi:uncharacterized protein YggE